MSGAEEIFSAPFRFQAPQQTTGYRSTIPARIWEAKGDGMRKQSLTVILSGVATLLALGTAIAPRSFAQSSSSSPFEVDVQTTGFAAAGTRGVSIRQECGPLGAGNPQVRDYPLGGGRWPLEYGLGDTCRVFVSLLDPTGQTPQRYTVTAAYARWKFENSSIPTIGPSFPLATSEQVRAGQSSIWSTDAFTPTPLGDELIVTVAFATTSPPPELKALDAPVRLLDTRAASATIDGINDRGLRAADSVTELQVAGRGGIPSTATIATINLTAVDAVDAGYATVYACGTRPNTSNLNYVSGDTIANLVITSIDPRGKICVFTKARTHLLVDVGSYATDPVAIKMLTQPVRLEDTRDSGTTIDGVSAGPPSLFPNAAGAVVKLIGRGGIPLTASAVIVTVTVVHPTTDGFLSFYPCSSSYPITSNLNFKAGHDTALTAIVGIGRADHLMISPGGTNCVFSSSGGDLLIDAVGTISGGRYKASEIPFRLVDTRGQNPSRLPAPVAAGSTFEFDAPLKDAIVSLNVTVDAPSGHGFLTVFSCEARRPNSSNLNFARGQSVAAAIITRVGSNGRVCIYSSEKTNLIIDYNASL